MKKIRSIWVGVATFIIGACLVAYAAVPINKIGTGLSLSSGKTLSNNLSTGVAGGQAVIGGTASGVLNNLFLQSNTSLDGNVIVQGPWFSAQQALSGGVVTLRVHNQSNTANSFGRMIASVAGSTAADPSLQMEIAGVASWNIGADNSDGDAFKLSTDTLGTLETGTKLRVDQTGRMSISDTGVVPTTGEQLVVATTIDDALTVHLKNASTGTQASGRFRATNDAGGIADFALYNSTHSNAAFAGRLSINAYDPVPALQYMCTKANCFQRWIVGGTGDAAEMMRLTTSGLGVGTAPNVNYRLHVAGATNAFAVVDQTSAAVDGSSQIIAQANSGTTTADIRMYNASASGSLAGLTRASSAYYYAVGASKMVVGGHTSIPLHLVAGAAERVRLPGAAPSSGQASMLIEVNDGAVTSIRQVTVSAVDLCGAGFRCLRVPN